jgi:hypothetical protein
MTTALDQNGSNEPNDKNAAFGLVPPTDATATAPNSQPDDLHDLFAAPEHDDAEDPLAGLRNDPNYAALIRDLEYIAREARQLFEPTEEPSDAVWANIQSKLNVAPDDETEK